MPPLSLGPAIARARQLCGNAEVWAILRFDQDNDRMEVYWSERTVAGAQTPDGAGGFRHYGTHAESVMIHGFAQALADHGAPRVAEIFLSRSPCSTSPLITVGGVQYPEGCASKLILLANQNPGIQFNVFYRNLYAGNPANPDPALRARSSAAVMMMNSCPNLEAGPLEDGLLVNP
jgi:hypothetical protein